MKDKGTSQRFDPALWQPVIRASICTGEQVAGFKEKASGRIVEVMLIRSPRDIEEFRRAYAVNGEIVKVY